MRRFAWLAAVLLGLAAAARADIHPNTQSGFPVDQAFHVGEVDNVNLFNGSLVLTVPIGISYPVGGGMSYSLKLIYSSNPWSFQEIVFDSGSLTQSFPSPCSNAGLGWRLSLGQLFVGQQPTPSCAAVSDLSNSPIYDDPSGSQHIFYPSLHPGESQAAGVFYTRDGSYLRLRTLSAGAHEIDFPDGMVHAFDAQGRLTEMRQRFTDGLGAPTDWVRVDYASSPGQWLLTDSRGRSHTITFRSDLPGLPPVISQIDLAAYNSNPASVPYSPATYTFSYSTATIARGCPNTDPAIGSSVAVPLLTAVGLPDGSSWTVAASDYISGLPLQSAYCSFNAGSILGLNLPTLARLEWTYQTYAFPPNSAGKPRRTTNPGVATRRTVSILGTTLGLWTYTTSSNPPGFPNTLVNSVTNPYGQKTERYFSTSASGALTGWSIYDYSLQFTRNVTSGGLNLTERTWDANGTLLRSEYALYERDVVTGILAEDRVNSNRRAVQSRTVFEDDAGRTKDVASTDFDGLGHYRTQTVSGSFPGGGPRSSSRAFNPARGTYTVDAAANAATGTFTPLAPSAPWVLGTSAWETTSEGGATARIASCYDAGTGALLVRRVHRADGLAETAQDLVTVFDIDSQGNTTAEKSYGGDVQAGIPVAPVAPPGASTDPCAMRTSLPASPEIQVNHTYQAGVRATSQYTGTGFRVLDQTIDANTGLVANRRDSTGLQVLYEYDTSGRMTWEKPDQDGWTQILYNRASLGSPPTSSSQPSVIVRRRANGSKGAAILATSSVLFDYFGRLFWEEETLPDGTAVHHQTGWDGAGNRASLSEWGTGTPAKKTLFLDYDPSGRPRKIRPSDMPADTNPASVYAHDVTQSSTGDRQVQRTASVALGTGSETPVTTTEIYDPQGRLFQVTEPSGSGGGSVTTTYGYDVGSRLVSVSTPAGVTQNRSFTYDRAGLLTAETHPEKGTAGNGTVTWSRFNSRGHPTRKVDGPNALSFTYDAAERLIQVSETSGSQRVLKTFSYASGNGTNDWRKGKLQSQSRFNYVTLGATPYTIELREAFTYGGVGGRVSGRTLESHVNGVTTPSESFAQAWTYDVLGNVATLGYPQCTHSACLAPAPRAVTFGFTQNRLTSVVNYATLTYLPNSQVSQVVHTNDPANPANNVIDTQTADPNGLPRPGALASARGAATLWRTNAYAFDAAGNIKAIGAATFTYDRVSRLLSATQYLEPTADISPRAQSYSYDAFGNLTSITTNGILLNTPTTAATNRLTAGTYDAAGNLTAWSSNLYSYGPFNEMWKYHTAAGLEWIYLYTADDERAWTFQIGANNSLWTLRDLDAKVLRQYRNNAGAWSVEEDDIYRGSLLLAAETPAGVRHFHLDHLGTPRLITDRLGQAAAYHVYYPYGQEATSFNQDTERLKFTGHERDLGDLASTQDDVDYMHARFYGTGVGRFLSVDPVLDAKNALKHPQGWNRLAYVQDNPLRFKDPTGKCIEDGCVVEGALLLALAESPAGQEVLQAGEVELAAVAEEVAPAVEETMSAAQRIAQNAETGRVGERLAGIPNILKASIKSLSETAKKRIPDALDEATKVLTEVKNYSGQVNLTKQLNDFVLWSRANGYQFVLVVKDPSKLSSALQRLVASGVIILRQLPPR